MRALSIRPTRKRVPGAEEILRGIKRIEYRSRPVSDRIIGQRFYIYAAMKFPSPRDVRKYCRLDWLPSTMLRSGGTGKLHKLPIGVIVGTARISKCTR
jgi:hypothetical protein